MEVIKRSVPTVVDVSFPRDFLPAKQHTKEGNIKNTSLVHPSRRVKLNGPVYTMSDQTSDFQDKSLFADERETNIEDSVISDGDREM